MFPPKLGDCDPPAPADGQCPRDGAVAASAFTLPALGFALAPVFESAHASWQGVGKPGDFSNDDYRYGVITIAQGVGERVTPPSSSAGATPRSTRSPATAGTSSSRSAPVARTWDARSAGLRPPRPSSAPATAASTTSAACASADRHAAARPLLHARARGSGRDRPALQRQRRAPALLPARPWRVAGRHRPVPVSGATDDRKTAAVGVPPGQCPNVKAFSRSAAWASLYVESVRVERAWIALEGSAAPVEVVARECGFGTVETMRRAFQRRTATISSRPSRRARAIRCIPSMTRPSGPRTMG